MPVLLRLEDFKNFAFLDPPGSFTYYVILEVLFTVTVTRVLGRESIGILVLLKI